MQDQQKDRALSGLDRTGIDLLIRNCWKERLKNSAAALRRYTSKDMHFRILGGPPSLPGPWIFDGQDEVIQAIGVIDTNLEFLHFDILDMIIDGQEVALRWHATFRNRGTGEPGDMSVFDHIVVQNGLISSYTEFLDTECFRRLMAGEPQPDFARQSNRPAGHFAGTLQPITHDPLAPPVDPEARRR